MNIYDFTVDTASGAKQSLSDYRGQVMLIVNTATQCGFRPQFKQLQRLYDTYQEQGLIVLAFPCNQFFRQEPGTNEEIQQFCKDKYDATFPIFSKVDVKGDKAHPLFNFLTQQRSGKLGKGIKWNFTKFLIDRQGNVVHRFSPQTSPNKMEAKIQVLLESPSR